MTAVGATMEAAPPAAPQRLLVPLLPTAATCSLALAAGAGPCGDIGAATGFVVIVTRAEMGELLPAAFAAPT
jgi:hypothetical protein